MSHGDGGKGSGRRKEDVKKIRDNWDLIFGKPKKDTTMIDDDDECFGTDERDEEEWVCDSCGGPMYRQAHWDYGQCDDCGARQELDHDF